MSLRVDRAARRVGAAPARVYAALVDAEAVARWLPPEGATGTIEAFEPRPGGAFRVTLRFASGEGGKTTGDSDTVIAASSRSCPTRGWSRSSTSSRTIRPSPGPCG